MKRALRPRKTQNMDLRLATLDDAPALFEWRNDYETRSASINTDEVPWPDHIAWLTRSLQSRERKIYIAEQDGAPVGTIRLDTSDDGVELSWTVAPRARGRGMAKEMIRRAIGIAGPCKAAIKAENIASQKAAASAGFCLALEGPMQEWRADPSA